MNSINTALFIAAIAFWNQAAIYGNDNRQDVHHFSDDSIEAKVARSVALLPRKSYIKEISSTEVALKLNTLEQNLIAVGERPCLDEPFLDQPSSLSSIGSGFLVAPDLLVTAGHVIKNESDCRQKAVVFGFSIDANAGTVVSAKKKDVYRCIHVKKQVLQESPLIDYAIVQLDRPVRDRPTLALRDQGKVNGNAVLTMIGHPWGLPMKVTSAGVINDNRHKTHFRAFLDTYPGNSGSPVFDSESGLVEGILVEGEVGDTTLRGDWPEGCWYSKVYCDPLLPYSGKCDSDQATGAKVIRASEFLQFLPH